MPTGTPNDPLALLRRARQRAHREERRLVDRMLRRMNRELRPLGLRVAVVPLDSARPPDGGPRVKASRREGVKASTRRG